MFSYQVRAILSDNKAMEGKAAKITFFVFIVLLSSCSLWQEGRNPSAFDEEKGLEGPVEFNAYHNIRPTRRSGGEFYQISFLHPKNLKEISFEFVNHKVKVHEVLLVKSSGKQVPVKGFHSKFLSAKRKHLSLRNLSRADDIQAVKLKVEGYENNDVILTVSFFSPDGFLPQEQGQALALRSFDPGHKAVATQALPTCLVQNAQLSHVVFESEQLHSLSRAEKRYFCRHFVPKLEQFIENHESVSQFLRTGEDLEKPLISLGGSLSYDRYENHLTVPFRLKKEQFKTMARRIESYYQKPRREASRGLSQQNQRQLGLQQSYEEYMNSDQGPELGYLDAQESTENAGHQRECLERLVDLGIHSTQAKSLCQDAMGNELEHVACVEFLADQYVLAGNAHHYCLEAKGKLKEYRPCMEKLISIDINHYDSNLFCQRTPSAYMQDQLLCVEEMIATGQSQYKSVRSCQKVWGQEQRFIHCLRDKAESGDPKKAAARCL